MFQPVLLEVYNFPMTSPVRPLGSNYTSVFLSEHFFLFSGPEKGNIRFSEARNGAD